MLISLKCHGYLFCSRNLIFSNFLFFLFYSLSRFFYLLMLSLFEMDGFEIFKINFIFENMYWLTPYFWVHYKQKFKNHQYFILDFTLMSMDSLLLFQIYFGSLSTQHKASYSFPIQFYYVCSFLHSLSNMCFLNHFYFGQIQVFDFINL